MYALKGYQAIKCCYCNNKGAYVVCSDKDCKEAFHLGCYVVRNGLHFKQRKNAPLCKLHWHQQAGQGQDKKRKLEESSAESPIRKKAKLSPENKLYSKKERSNKLCNAEKCQCPKGKNFYNSGHWNLKFCEHCQKISAHVICAGVESKWTCPWCFNNDTTESDDLDESIDSKTDLKHETGSSSKSKTAIQSMKKSFCAQVDPKRLDRSPLGIKQKVETNSVSKTSAKQNVDDKTETGKENNLVDQAKKSKSSKKPRLAKEEKVRNRKTMNKNKKMSSTEQNGKGSKKSPNQSVKKGSRQKNKCDKSSPRNSLPNKVKAKCPEEKKSAKKKKAKVISKTVAVEPKKIEDRQLFHVKNNLPIEGPEPEAEEDYQWLVDVSSRQIDDFLDLNEGEKAFFKLWNKHLHHNPCYGDVMMIPIMEKFIDEVGEKIWQMNLYKNFLLHLSNFYDFGILDQATILRMTIRMQKKHVEVDSKFKRKCLSQTCDDDEEENMKIREESINTLTIEQEQIQTENDPIMVDDTISNEVTKKDNHIGVMRRRNSASLCRYNTSGDEFAKNTACPDTSESNDEDEIPCTKKAKADSEGQESFTFINDGATDTIKDLPSGNAETGSFASVTMFYGEGKPMRKVNHFSTRRRVDRRSLPASAEGRQTGQANEENNEAKGKGQQRRGEKGNKRNWSL